MSVNQNRNSSPRFKEKSGTEYIYEREQEDNKHQRKTQRLDIANKTITSASYGLAGSLIIVSALVLFEPILNYELSEYKDFFTFFTASIFSVLTLALGFVAGSSID